MKPPQLLKIRSFDVGPGPPYAPAWHQVGLFQVQHTVHGKRYFLRAIGTGCSQTWLTDVEAEAWQKEKV